MDIGYILFVCLVLYVYYKIFMTDTKRINEKNSDNLNHTKPKPYNFETKESSSAKESEIMKCGWPAGTANLYDDNYLKSLGQSDEEEPKDE
jgi:amino acid permease